MDITDACGYAGKADQVFTPRSEEDVATIVVRASSEGIPVTVMGALTGLAGGAVPKGGWAISMAQLRKLDVFPGKARAGTGELLREVQAAAAAPGQLHAPDPPDHPAARASHRGAHDR